ncbi:MAG: hypothetical protein HZB80_05465 [Deltaproteobacteria bacterium]|nr:hypothetical protein [Deltaproteobacteria bacterium]
MATHETEKTTRCNNCTSPEQDDSQRTIIVIRGEEKSIQDYINPGKCIRFLFFGINARFEPELAPEGFYQGIAFAKKCNCIFFYVKRLLVSFSTACYSGRQK